MNILLLTHSYPDVINSWRGTFVREQAISLSKYHNVTVVFFKVDSETFAPLSGYTYSKEATATLTEYTVIIYRSFHGYNQVNYLCKTWKFINKVILDKIKPDLIHSHLSYPAGLLGTIIQKRKKIPGCITEHSRIETYFRSWLHRQAVIYSLKNATAVIAVSNPLKDEIYSLTSRNAHVVYNIVDTARFKLSNPDNGAILNLGFLGGLGSRNKGLDVLLNAVSQLKNFGFFLHIGGNGSLLEDYRKLAQNLGIESNCRFYGAILPENVPSFYNVLDVFVLPSRYETFGIVLVEAMACGVPVIATRCGGPVEIVTEASGILIGKDNPEALAKAIVRIKENKEEYNREAIRDYAEVNFGSKAFISKISLVYEELLKS